MLAFINGLIACGALAASAWLYYTKHRWQRFAIALKTRYKKSRRAFFKAHHQAQALSVKLNALLKDPSPAYPVKHSLMID